MLAQLRERVRAKAAGAERVAAAQPEGRARARLVETDGARVAAVLGRVEVRLTHGKYEVVNGEGGHYHGGHLSATEWAGLNVSLNCMHAK